MLVSIRKKFRKGDPGWDEYAAFIKLPGLTEVRSVDRALNDFVADCGCYSCSLHQIEECRKTLPAPSSESEYCLIAVECLKESDLAIPRDWQLLGYDLTDETLTSSLLNCGPWSGELQQFTKRVNHFGLLSRDDADRAALILPKEWGDEEPHAHVTIWALYEQRSP